MFRLRFSAVLRVLIFGNESRGEKRPLGEKVRRRMMLAPGGLRNARGYRDRRDREPTLRRERKVSGPEVTLTQAMNAGKWELLLWLEARAKAASDQR
jgi:hypothetical protein